VKKDVRIESESKRCQSEEKVKLEEEEGRTHVNPPGQDNAFSHVYGC
jgi:hypothetical protein